MAAICIIADMNKTCLYLLFCNFAVLCDFVSIVLDTKQTVCFQTNVDLAELCEMCQATCSDLTELSEMC